VLDFVDTNLNAPLAQSEKSIRSWELLSTDGIRKHFSVPLLEAVPILQPLLNQILVVPPPLLMKINIPATVFRGFLLFKPQRPTTLFSQVELALQDASDQTQQTEELKKLATPAIEFCKTVKSYQLDSELQPSEEVFTVIDKAFKFNELLQRPLCELHVLPPEHFIQLTDNMTGRLIYDTLHGLSL
jgi:hypothetical protein